MDIYDALYTTRAMRRLKPDPIPLDAQARILDAAIRAPNIEQGWRFLLVDDAEIKSQLAALYLQAFERMVGGRLDEVFAGLMTADTPMGQAVRSGVHLARHFADVPLLLIGFGRTREGSGIYPALWSAMLAARAEGIGSTLTGMLQTFFADEVFDILGVPKDAGWYMHGVITMGYRPVSGALVFANRSTRSRHAIAGRAISVSQCRRHCGRNDSVHVKNKYGIMSNTLNSKNEPDKSTVYQIRIKGHLDRQWADWFGGLTITLEDNSDTLLTGPVVDQAALHGLIKKVRDLGMTLISVIRVEPSRVEASDAPQQIEGSGLDSFAGLQDALSLK